VESGVHSIVNAQVGAVYVLTVRTFVDRIAHIERELGKHGIAFEFVLEHDADLLDHDLVARRFAPSDMKRTHQSLVLKHICAWERARAAGHERVLVLEDDVVLDPQFGEGFGRALAEADRLAPGWSIYLGRGDNVHVGQKDAKTALIPAGPLPATEAIVCDREAVRRRLAFLDTHRITRPADWLLREMDPELGIGHWWLSRPIVEQGSMNGRFTSALDRRRFDRFRAYTWLRYRWDKYWRGLRYARQGRARSDG
jgi:glycosyl transferase family 25